MEYGVIVAGRGVPILMGCSAMRVPSPSCLKGSSNDAGRGGAPKSQSFSASLAGVEVVSIRSKFGPKCGKERPETPKAPSLEVVSLDDSEFCFRIRFKSSLSEGPVPAMHTIPANPLKRSAQRPRSSRCVTSSGRTALLNPRFSATESN